jgi:hypothetical protein
MRVQPELFLLHLFLSRVRASNFEEVRRLSQQPPRTVERKAVFAVTTDHRMTKYR